MHSDGLVVGADRTAAGHTAFAHKHVARLLMAWLRAVGPWMPGWSFAGMFFQSSGLRHHGAMSGDDWNYRAFVSDRLSASR